MTNDARRHAITVRALNQRTGTHAARVSRVKRRENDERLSVLPHAILLPRASAKMLPAAMFRATQGFFDEYF
jgi:hypothetical protein